MGIVRKDGAPEHECDIVMELCSKGDLRSFLKKPDNEISWRRRITMAIDIAKYVPVIIALRSPHVLKTILHAPQSNGISALQKDRFQRPQVQKLFTRFPLSRESV
jgi:hypothetical protein